MSLNPFNESVVYAKKSYPKNLTYWETYLSGGFYHTPPNPAETQKARGIFFLMNKAAVVKAVFGWNVPKHILFKAGEKFSDGSFNYPVFVRPCPIVPRHGFVDSTFCKDAEEVNKLSVETYNAEPEAEFLVTKPIDASYGAILTDGVLTFAVGNDGATSGKNVKYFYISEDPIAPAISLDPTVLLEGEVPFYELVLDKQGNTNLVQVRSAPGVPKCKDYVPEKVEVQKIIKAEGDLLDWERLMHEVDPATTIVDHTNGSLASHYAIHAIINRVPIFTSYLPNIGDVVEATAENTEITDEDREKFYRAFCIGFSSGKRLLKKSKFFKGEIYHTMQATLKLSLACLHNFSAIAMAKDFEVVGITLGLFLRTCFTVSAGETRYVPDSSINGNDTLMAWKNSLKASRHMVYQQQFEKSADSFIDDIPTIYSIFKDVTWQDGFGGKAWARCTQSSMELFNACVKKDINSVVELFNKVLHEEHNGGRYLNKIIDVGQFDRAAENPSMYALTNVNTVIDLLSTAWDTSDSNEIAWDKFVPLRYTKLVIDMPPSGRWKIKSATVNFIDGKAQSITVESDKLPNKKLTFEFSLKEKVMAACNCCYAEGDIKLLSIPYFWSFNGVNIISKARLNKLIDKAMEPKEEKESSNESLDIETKVSMSKVQYPDKTISVIPPAEKIDLPPLSELPMMTMEEVSDMVISTLIKKWTSSSS